MKNRIEFIFDEVTRSATHKVKDIASIRKVLENCDLQGKSVLEVGCGIGDNLIYCVQRGTRYAEGFDISGESIKVAQSKAARLSNIFFHKCSIEEYNTELKFNFILALGVFEYFKNPPRSLRKISSFLTNDGTLVLLISKPLFIKKVSFLCRIILSKIPLRFILPVAKLLGKIFRVFDSQLKKILYVGESTTYTIEQTILESLMVPRYNIFHHRVFSRYLHKEGFSIDFFNGVAPSMICMIAKKQVDSQK